MIPHTPCLALIDSSSGSAELLLGVLVLLVVMVAALQIAGRRRLGQLEMRLQKLDALEKLGEIQELLAKAAADRGDLDQRRLEHVLVDVRDGIKRLEGSILGVLERQAASPVEVATPRPDPTLRERVVNRLLALGYTDIRVVTEADELQELSREDADGSIVVEVHQGSSQLKGRVLLRGGTITDVDLNSFYPIFP